MREKIEQEELLDESHSAEPDTFQEKLKKYLTYAAGAVGAFAVIVIILMVYTSNQREQEAEATLRLSSIRPVFDSGQFENALNGVILGEGQPMSMGLREIASTYSGTEAGKLAALYAGQALVMNGKYDEAETYFDMCSGAEATITQVGANAGLAACRVQAGSLAEGANLYERTSLLAEEIGSEQHYQLFAAMLFEKAGDKDDALRLYRDIVSSNQYSQYAGEAKAGIVRLGESIDK